MAIFELFCIRKEELVGRTGFEPVTNRFFRQELTSASLMSLLLYQAELTALYSYEQKILII